MLMRSWNAAPSRPRTGATRPRRRRRQTPPPTRRGPAAVRLGPSATWACATISVGSSRSPSRRSASTAMTLRRSCATSNTGWTTPSAARGWPTSWCRSTTRTALFISMGSSTMPWKPWTAATRTAAVTASTTCRSGAGASLPPLSFTGSAAPPWPTSANTLASRGTKLAGAGTTAAASCAGRKLCGWTQILQQCCKWRAYKRSTSPRCRGPASLGCKWRPPPCPQGRAQKKGGPPLPPRCPT